MKNFKQQLLKYLLEFLIVAFGVFLGIYVNESVAQGKIDKEVDKSLNYIVDELERNKEQLKSIVAYHEEIKTSFRGLRDKIPEEALFQSYFLNKEFKFNTIPGWRGVGLPGFEDIAFEGAKVSGISQEYEIETIHTISQIYKQLHFQTEFGRTVLDRMLEMNSDTKLMDALSILNLLTGDVLTTEINLMKHLDSSIAKLKTQIQNKS